MVSNPGGVAAAAVATHVCGSSGRGICKARAVVAGVAVPNGGGVDVVGAHVGDDVGAKGAGGRCDLRGIGARVGCVGVAAAGGANHP